MEIITIEAGPFATNCYLIAGESNPECLLIDAPPDSKEQIIEIIQEKKLFIVGIVLTHSHWDHTMDAGELRKFTNAPIYVHKDDEYRLLNPGENSLIFPPYELEILQPDQYLVNKDKLIFNSSELEVRHTPGHTEGSVCLICHTDKIIFSGDTLFYRSVGRTDFPGGSWETLLESLDNQLMTLEDSYKVYPGHGIITTIGDERKYNTFINRNFI